ncbi:MAG: histidinol-phosphate aminotransferase family protein [Gemmatimonadetes bacterium]|nr:histidinol-phosphate aminotransferase family protein [Gemmatimonadota bacterium]
MSPFPRADYELLAPYAPDRRPVDIDLSDNTNLWGTHPAALARIQAATSDDLARYPELYADRLRAAVSERFDVPVDCVTTGAGSDDVLDSAFRAAFGRGATVRYASPTFSMVEPLARMNGIGAEAVPWSEAALDPRLLLEGDPDLVYVCRPNNPTGELLPEEWIERLLWYRSDGGPLIILDEAYADFAEETLISWAVRTPRLLVARTASKAFGLAGLRCGFGVAQPETTREIEKSRGPYKVSRLAAEAAAAALLDEDGWMAGTVAECLTNRARLINALRKRGLEPLESRTNFVLFASPSGSASSDALTLRERGIAVRPFAGIEAIGEGLRVTVGPWPLMERFLDALDGATWASAASGAKAAKGAKGADSPRGGAP